MKTLAPAIIFIFLLIALQACTYGNDITAEHTKLNKQQYEPNTNEIEIYFDDTYKQTGKEFIQIAFIEVTGAANTKNDELMQQLKSKAQSQGAEAVINVKKTYREREEGDVLSDYSRKYQAPILSGIAVKWK